MDNKEIEASVLRQLWELYANAVLPLERLSHFEHFHSAAVTAEEFEAKPQVLLIGQYSTGKTSMVQWLTGTSSQHFDIRPQPSTDKFMAVVHGEDERVISGSAATVLPQLPYRGLAGFGAKFLSNFQTVVLPSEILKEVTFVDTPGVLAGCKQRIGRAYDFSAICAWMAERADLVLLIFDVHKLDISDELREVMEVLRPFSDKVRCVLNKADQVDASNLVRVYGALLWNVGKIMQTPEITRVYASSFWDQGYKYTDHKSLFEEDREAVLKELRSLPQTALLRKVNFLVTRIRKVKAHLCTVAHIRSQLPLFARVLGWDSRMQPWLKMRLPALLLEVAQLRNLPPGDLQECAELQKKLECFQDLSRLPCWDGVAIDRLDRAAQVDVPALVAEVGGVSRVKEPLRSQPTHTSTGWFSWSRQKSRASPY